MTNELTSIPSDAVAQQQVESLIYTIRGVQVMLDRDLAKFYGVETKVLNQAVKRNSDRFPEDFMFQLTEQEYECLRSQIVTLNMEDSEGQYFLRSQNVTIRNGRGQHTKYLPHAFTEEGVAQLSGVLKSKVASDTSVRIMRAFAAMRHFLSVSAGMFQRIESLERHQIASDQRLDETNMRIDQILDRMDDGSLK